MGSRTAYNWTATIEIVLPPFANYILRVCFVVYLLLGCVGAFRRQAAAWRELAALAVAFGILHWTTGFPAVIQSFAGSSPLFAILIMFVCVVMGMLANYFFELRSPFTWNSFVKPLLVSPIVLFPLWGTVETRTDIQTLELISLAFLAFQNGFFWRSVFKRASTHSK